jgi:DNA-binding GntR family transcriptional regulator
MPIGATGLLDAEPRAAPAAVVAIDRRLLHEQAVARVRDMIVREELSPGTRLNERVLCEQLRISRTPLREALKTLAAEGLVQLLPNRGATVAPIDAQDVAELFRVIESLEALAGELACEHATEADIAEIAAMHYRMRLHYVRGELADYFRCNQAIHDELVAASGNGVLADVYRNLSGRLRRARFAANLSRERWTQAMREHDEILATLTRRDGPRLRTLLAEHLRHKRDALALMRAGEPSQAIRRRRS